MATKSARVVELEEGIAQATAILDEADASRIGLQEAFDSAREALADAYGKGFEKAVTEYLGDSEDDQDEADENETE